MAVFAYHQHQQLVGARGGETSTSSSSSSISKPSTLSSSRRTFGRVPRCKNAARRCCSTSRLVVLAVSSPVPGGLSAAATESASEAAIATSAAAAAPTRVVVETPLPLAIVVEPPTSGSGGDGAGLPPRDDDGEDGPGDGDGSDGRRKFFRFNLIAGLIAGVKARAAADPEFATKLLIECGLDLSIILGVNAASRGSRFFSEVEFVASQAAVSLLNDFALVYLLAPTGLPAPSAAARGSLAAALASLPAHAFQSGGFPLGARLACLGARAVQYGAVGLVMGCAGSALVRALVAAREAADPSYSPPPTEQRVLDTGLAWCYFMAVSSNLRYNAINGVEDWAYARARRGVAAAAAAAAAASGGAGAGAAAPLLLASPAAARSVSVALRLSNNVFGAHSFIQLAEFLKLDRPREARKQQTKKQKKQRPGGKEEGNNVFWWKPRSAAIAA